MRMVENFVEGGYNFALAWFWICEEVVCSGKDMGMKILGICGSSLGLSPNVEETIERRMCTLCVRMMSIVTAQCDHFFIAMNGKLVVLVTVVPQKALHQPSFGMVWVHIENSIEKYLGNFPPFF